MWRYLPPAGTPVTARELLGALGGAFSSNGDCHAALSSFTERLGVRHAFAFGSGRAALWAILRALARLRPGRDVVALPAYTCYSVPAAVVRAGLRVHPVEIDPRTWDFDYVALEAVPADRLLCVLSVHLFGLLADVPRARAIAAAKGAFLVDDAAQALGARLGGRWAGTMGDVGLYSLGRGKALGAVEGGIAVSDSAEIAGELEAEVTSLPATGLGHSVALAAKMVAGAALLRPSLYRLPQSLPFLKLGVTVYDPGFPLQRLSGVARGLFEQLLTRMDELHDARRRNAERLASGLAESASVSLPTSLPAAQPVFIRFPVLMLDPKLRRRALAQLTAAGIGASGYYPDAICEISRLAPHLTTCAPQPAATAVARRLLTLPTHPFVTARDIERMLGILKSV